MFNKLTQTFYNDKNILDEVLPPDTLTLGLQVRRNVHVQIRIEFAFLFMLSYYNYQITKKDAMS